MPWLLFVDIALAVWGALLEPLAQPPRRRLPPSRTDAERYAAALREQQERTAEVIPLREAAVKITFPHTQTAWAMELEIPGLIVHARLSRDGRYSVSGKLLPRFCIRPAELPELRGGSAFMWPIMLGVYWTAGAETAAEPAKAVEFQRTPAARRRP